MKPKTNWKRLFKRFGIGLLTLLAMLLLTNAILNWRAGARLEANYERLRAAGEPVSFRDLAAQQLNFEKFPPPIWSGEKERLNNFTKEHAAFFDTPLGKAYAERRDQDKLPTLEQTKAIEKTLARHGELLTLVKQAAKQPWNGSAIIFFVEDEQGNIQQMLDQASPARSAVRLLNWQMQVQLVRGEPNEAVATGIEILRLSRLYEQEPALVSYLISIAMRHIAYDDLNHAVRQDSLTEESRNQLRAELKKQTGLAGLQRALKRERVFGLEIVAGWRRDAPANFLGWLIKNWESGMIDFYDELLPKIGGKDSIDFGQLKESVKKYPTIVQHLMPTIEASYDATNRNIANQRCLYVLNEFERYKATHGKEATGIADLSIDAEQTIDPFNGKPLIVKHTDKGWLIYSVFQNKKDDGGNFKDRLDCGLKP